MTSKPDAPGSRHAAPSINSATRGQWIFALSVLLASAALFAGIVPFARVRLPKIDAFIPVLESALTINDLITAVLLFAAYFRERSYAMLALACGYFFNGCLIVAHCLSFPGAFSESGVLGGGSQTTAWLYVFWHGGFPLFVIAYALLRRDDQGHDMSSRRTAIAAAVALVGVLALVAALVLLATAGHDLLPVVIVAGDFSLLISKGVSPAILLLTVLALVAVGYRRKLSTLDLWVTVVMCVWVLDVALSAVIGSSRYDLAWYGGRIYALLASCVLLTALLLEINRLHGRLADALVETTDAKIAAEKANLAKSEFLSRMSHELRTPLNAILGFAQAMETDSPPPSPPQQECIREILRGGWYLLDLINEILDLALIESGRLSLSKESVSLGDVLLECQAMMEPQARKRGLHLTFPRLDEPVFVHADRTRLKQVFINLLSNAVKYNRSGGAIVVGCKPGRPGRVRIAISDTGAGLPPEKLDQLFQPFNRLGQEGSTEEGTGIGLVVTKRLIEQMSGTVGVESTVGVGTTFHIELPAAPPPHAEVEPPQATKAVVHFSSGEQVRTLLYVEDNPANLKLIEQLVRRRPDLRLLTAVDGQSGIEIARSLLPDIILMDINLPGMNGITAMQILRADPLTAHIPVIALSANAMPRDIEKGLALGFFRYLTKPIKVAEFMAAVDIDLSLASKSVAQGQ